jgi:hypothetical protein
MLPASWGVVGRRFPEAPQSTTVFALRHILVGPHAIAAAPHVDHGGAVEQAVDDGGADHAVGEDLAPITKAAVGGEDDRALLVAAADDLEDLVR